MEKSQIAAIIIALFLTAFFIVMFHKNKKRNHHQDLVDEVVESKVAEQNFEKSEGEQY